jgi:hypothetical protein
MNEAAATILQQSKDALELKRAAATLAGSALPDDLAVLQRHLGTSEFLDRLDPPGSSAGAYTSLRVARIIKTVMDRRDPPAAAVLLRLIIAAPWQSSVIRVQLLIRALAEVRPSPPEAISYWERFSGPESPLAFDVIEAVCINQSPPAMTLFAKKLGSEGHGPAAKVAWLRQIVLPRRNDEPLLNTCEQLLLKDLSLELQGELVAVLFDYRPDDWYRGCKNPQPPPRLQATPAARQIMLRIARRALTEMELGAALQARLRAARLELGDKEKLG